MGMLKGLKILDFTTLLPGPFATMMFADMGADVIRVESSTRIDLIRTFEPIIEGKSAVHQQLNRSKRSLTLDLKKPEAVEIIKKLVMEYDIVLEQFRPGIMGKLGVDYETLKKVNPKIIYCSITGYGQTGPYRDRPGHDNNYLSIAGTLDYSRRKQERPAPLGIQVADLAGGSMHAVIGVLAAALNREKTGVGDYIDISMTDAAFSLNVMSGSGYLATGNDVLPEADLLNGGSFYDYYETKDGRFYSVGSLEPPFRKLLCEKIGGPALLEVAMSEKEEDQQEFKRILEKKFKEKNFEEWQSIFGDSFHGCVEPVLTFGEACENEQIMAREMVIELPKNSTESVSQIAFPIKFKNHEAVYQHIGSHLDEHIEEILQGQGMTKEEIHGLREKGVFGHS